MAQGPGIEEIRERVEDLLEALRSEGRADLANELEVYATMFAVPTKVRRAVAAIEELVRYWREHPEGLPDSPKVQISANVLEDACKEALAEGFIMAARPTLVAQSKRKLSVAMGALLAGIVLLLVPIMMIEAGVDFTDIHVGRELPPIDLPQGEEGNARVTILVESLVPDATKGVEFRHAQNCGGEGGGASCGETQARLWERGRLPTFEIKLENQAYGLLFSFADIVAEGNRVGSAKVLLAATDNTPEGVYRIPLRGRYIGYRPQKCEIWKKAIGQCPKPVVADEASHSGLPVPTVVVRVLRGDPSKRMGEKRLAQAKAEEAKKAADKRAQEITGVLEELRKALKAADTAVRTRKWEDAREKLDKLGVLFEPLYALSNEDMDLLPVEVEDAKADYEAHRKKLTDFEIRVFELTYKTLNAPKNKRVDEDTLMKRVAAKNRISREYLGQIYTSQADEIQRRLDAIAAKNAEQIKAKQAALERRCGKLPTTSWKSVETYLKQRTLRGDLILGDCMTPRLSDTQCWTVSCTYQRRFLVAVDKPKVVTRHRADFYLARDKVLRHGAVSNLK